MISHRELKDSFVKGHIVRMLERVVLVTVELSPGDQYGDIQVLSVDGSSVILRMPEETFLPIKVTPQVANLEPDSEANLGATTDVADANVSLSGKPPRIIDYVELVLQQSEKWSTLSELVSPMKEIGWITTATPGREEETLSSSLRKDKSGRVVRTFHGLWGLPDWKPPKPSGIRRQALNQEPSPDTIRSLVTGFIVRYERFTIPEMVDGIKKRKPDAQRATIQAELTRSFQRGEVKRLSPGNYLSLRYIPREQEGNGSPELPFRTLSKDHGGESERHIAEEDVIGGRVLADTDGKAIHMT